MRAGMRVLHVTDRLSHRGGAHRFLLGVLEALARSGHEVLVAVGQRDPGVETPAEVRKLPGLEARDRVGTGLAALVAELRPDVVHLHTIVNPAVLEAAEAWPAVITVQDHRYFCPGRGKVTLEGRPCRSVLDRKVCRDCFADPDYADAIFDLTVERLAAVSRLRITVLSRYMARELEAAGVPEGRIGIVPPCVHGLDLKATDTGAPCVLFVGRLVEAKGVLAAIEAHRLSGIDLPLVVAGTGPLRAAVEAAGAAVLGWIDGARLSHLYRRARALLLPSRWQEPFGIVGLEALAFGVPVVAWDSGGIGEWHPGGHTLVPWGDVAGLGAALARAVTTRAALPLGFTVSETLRRLTGTYGEVVAASDASRCSPARPRGLTATPARGGPSNTKR